jgi:Gly-Xaa carboxypeptidase
MRYLSSKFVAGAVTVSLAVPSLAFKHETQYPLQADEIPGGEELGHGRSKFRCDLVDPIDPSDDGLLSSDDMFSGAKALEVMVKRHQSLVRIPSVCYDDLGDFDEDDRWKPFYDVPRVLEESYLNV